MLDDMRTTLTLDDDVLASARALAAQRGVPIGTIVSDLARRGLAPDQPTAARNGIRLFPVRPDAGPVTPDLVKTLGDGPSSPSDLPSYAAHFRYTRTTASCTRTMTRRPLTMLRRTRANFCRTRTTARCTRTMGRRLLTMLRRTRRISVVRGQRRIVRVR